MDRYAINLDELCRNQSFKPEEVVSSDLVYPRGAVPNSQLIWVRVDLASKERKFITLPLLEFHRYVSLPDSSIGGWTEGDLGTDAANTAHLEKYAIGDSGSDNSGHDAGDEAHD